MRASFQHLEPILAGLKGAPGDFAEFGVWRGETFMPLAALAKAQNRLCHAIDSFLGMAEPTEDDRNPQGVQEYVKGALNVGGSGEFRKKVARLPNVRIWEGYLPGILPRIRIPAGLAFCHVDLDHYTPTLAVLGWCWERTNPGGVLCCHDWLPQYDCMATKAAREFMARFRIAPAGESASLHIWWRK